MSYGQAMMVRTHDEAAATLPAGITCRRHLLTLPLPSASSYARDFQYLLALRWALTPPRLRRHQPAPHAQAAKAKCSVRGEWLLLGAG